MINSFRAGVSSTPKSSLKMSKLLNMAKSYNNLRAKMSPEARVKAKERGTKLLEEMPLHKLRRARERIVKNNYYNFFRITGCTG